MRPLVVAPEGRALTALPTLGADATIELGRTVLQGALRGATLATERDLDTLLAMILTQARRLSSADAGSLYRVEQDGDSPYALRFKLPQNTTLPDLPFSEFTSPIDHASLSGYVAATGERLMVDDVSLLPEHVTYRQNRSFDEKFGYRTKSMLVLPMFTLKDEVIGVLQLINRKRDFDTQLTTATAVAEQVIPFDEYSQLYEDIERLFEGFVTAAVTAIESRDPRTSGHSFRVATLTTGLAEMVDRAGEGPYRGLQFSKDQLRELRYAGLLHDFGKVGVREQVLVKQKKLYGSDLTLVRNRFQFLMQHADLEYEPTSRPSCPRARSTSWRSSPADLCGLRRRGPPVQARRAGGARD